MSKEKPTDDPRHTIQPGGLVMKSTIVIMEVKERGCGPLLFVVTQPGRTAVRFWH